MGHDSVLVFCSYNVSPVLHYRAVLSLIPLSSFSRPAQLSNTGIPGGVALGLTNMAIGVGGVQMIVKVGAEKTLSVPTLTMTMGTCFISNVTTTVNGQVLISTH